MLLVEGVCLALIASGGVGHTGVRLAPWSGGGVVEGWSGVPTGAAAMNAMDAMNALGRQHRQQRQQQSSGGGQGSLATGHSGHYWRPEIQGSRDPGIQAGVTRGWIGGWSRSAGRVWSVGAPPLFRCVWADAGPGLGPTLPFQFFCCAFLSISIYSACIFRNCQTDSE